MQTIQLNTINNPSKKSLQKKASKSLMQGNFKQSFNLFQNAFWLDTSDLDSRIGLYLSDMGEDFGQEAIGIYEFYQSVLACETRSNRIKVQKMILNLIEAFDNKTHYLSGIVQDSKEAILESYNAINYTDIKVMLKTKDFKEIYSGFPFNTRFVFSQKSDFYEFLYLLAKHDYIDSLMHYIDALPKYDQEVLPLIEMLNTKLKEKGKNPKKKNPNE